MDKRDKGYTLYKKGLSCTEISKKLDVSINTVKSWRKRYWTQGADAPAKRTLHPEDAPAAPDPETRPKQGAPPGNVNAVGAGAPKGNRNAVKHGGWSELMFRSWTEEHRQLLDACDEDVDAEELLINELKLLTAREGYLLERISHYSKEEPMFRRRPHPREAGTSSGWMATLKRKRTICSPMWKPLMPK